METTSFLKSVNNIKGSEKQESYSEKTKFRKWNGHIHVISTKPKKASRMETNTE